jgi:hypothetical protein
LFQTASRISFSSRARKLKCPRSQSANQRYNTASFGSSIDLWPWSLLYIPGHDPPEQDARVSYHIPDRYQFSFICVFNLHIFLSRSAVYPAVFAGPPHENVTGFSCVDGRLPCTGDSMTIGVTPSGMLIEDKDPGAGGFMGMQAPDVPMDLDDLPAHGREFGGVMIENQEAKIGRMRRSPEV